MVHRITTIEQFSVSDYILEALAKIQLNFTPPDKKGKKVKSRRELADSYSLENTEEISGDEAENEEEEEESEDEDEAEGEAEGEADYTHTINSVSEDQELSSAEYYTPKDEISNESEDEINEGGHSSPNIAHSSDESDDDEPIPSHSDTENLLYSDTQGYSDYDTDQQDADNEDSEDEGELGSEGEESEEDEDLNSQAETDTLDGDSELSDATITKRILSLDRKRHSRVDMRVVLVVDKLSIKVFEKADQAKLDRGEYEGILGESKYHIKQLEILEIAMEDLRIDFDNTKVLWTDKKGGDDYTNLKMNLGRIYIEDLQKEQNKDKKGRWVPNADKARRVIPSCYQMILSNPVIEKHLRKQNNLGPTSDTEESIVIQTYRMNNQQRKQKRAKQLVLNAKIKNQDVNADFVFGKLRLIVTIPILERLTMFLKKVQDVKTKYLDDKDEPVDEEEENQLNDGENEPNDEEIEQNRPIEEMKVVELDKSTKPTESIADEHENQEDEDQGLIESIRKRREEHLMKGKKLTTTEKIFTSAVNAIGTIVDLTIWIPLNSKDEFSRVLCLSLSVLISFRQAAQSRYILNEVTESTIKVIPEKDSQDATVLINNFIIYMLNRHLIKAKGKLSDEKLLQPSRISLVYDKVYRSQINTDISNIDVTIEPLDFKVGFREVDNFKEIQETFMKLSEGLNKATAPAEAENDKHKGVSDYELTRSNKNSSKLDEKVSKSEEEKKRPGNSDQLKHLKARKPKQIVKMRVIAKMESLIISLMDDTGKHEYPLVNFTISNIYANFEQENGLDDSVSLIMKRMGLSNDPFMKVKAILELNGSYYNMDSGAYEPLIEPWKLLAKVKQKTNKSPMKIDLESREMLNISMTYGMALAIKKIMTRMKQDSKKWESEEKMEETKNKMQEQISKRQLTMGTLAKQAMAKREEQKLESRLNRDLSKQEDNDLETTGFFYENWLGKDITVILEGVKKWQNIGIEISQFDEESATVDLSGWEDIGESKFRATSDYRKVLKNVQKSISNGKVIHNLEEHLLCVEAYIEGFEPVQSIPIEIAGSRAYELTPLGESKSERKKRNYTMSLIVDITQQSTSKRVSFESQLKIINNIPDEVSIIGIEAVDNEKVLTPREVEQYLRGGGLDNLHGNLDEHGFTLLPNEAFRVPLEWIINDKTIYYK